MAKRLSNENAIGEVLREIIQINKLEKGLHAVSIEQAWKNLMGNGVNHYTKNILFKNNTLYVELSSSVLREELSYGKQKIIKMLNEEVNQEIVKDLVLR